MIEKIVDVTESICKHCYKVVPAKVIERGGQLFLRKTCPEHGDEEILHVYDTLCLYNEMKRIFYFNSNRPTYPRELVAYITSKCNLSCKVCYENSNSSSAKELTFQELISALEGYEGQAVYLSGGEPTLRQDIFDIIVGLKKRKYFVGVFSNGIKLADRGFARKLKNAGLDLVILSLESLRGEDLHYFSGRKDILLKKLEAIQNIKQEGIGIYVFSYIAPGFNDDQIPGLIDFAKRNIDVIDILNFTPIWRIGRFDNQLRIPASLIYKRLDECGYSFQEIIACTEFSHLCFEIKSELSGSKWTRQTPCIQLIYVFKIRNEFLKITELLDLISLNRILSGINSIITNRNMVIKWVFFLLRFPYFSLSKSLIKNHKLRLLFIGFLSDIFRKMSFKRVVSARKLTVMTGQVHGFEDADFRFIKKCTLFAIDAEKGERISFCTRQMRKEMACFSRATSCKKGE